jgi:hypothetical protein
MPRRGTAFLAPVVACLLAVSLTITSYSRLSYSMDEPAHIAAGMEWLDEGRYSYEEQHAPLGR